MAKYTVEDTSLKAVADAMRDWGDIGGDLKFPSGFIDGVSSTYVTGHVHGMQEGYEDGFSDGEHDGYIAGEADGIEQGKQAEQAVTDALLSNTDIGHYYNDRVTTLRAYAFNYCTTLLSANFPNCTKINSHAFANCSRMTELRLPRLSSATTGYNASTCTVLEFADFGSIRQIYTNTFENCKALKTLVLRHTSVQTLNNVDAFKGTPYASGGSGGKIYVPSALIESYKTATNWSALYGYGTVEFVALEGSEYE